MPPVSNTVKNHPLSAWINPPSPVPAATRRGAETAQSAAMYENDVSFSTRAKTSVPYCGEVLVAVLKFPPVAASPVLLSPFPVKIAVALVRKSEGR